MTDNQEVGTRRGAITRTIAEAEGGCLMRLYRTDDGELQTYAELCEALESEAASLDSEQWTDGYFNVGEYVVEACLVGIYRKMEVLATGVIRDTGETVVEYFDEDTDKVVAERLVVDV